MSRKTLYTSLLAFALAFAVSVFALWMWKAPRSRQAKTAVVAYEDFGPPSMSFELQIGSEWNQWKSEGHELPDDVPVKVVVYCAIELEQMRKQFPVLKGKSDYRYLDYHRAIEFLDKHLKEVEQYKQQSATEDEVTRWEQLQKTLTNTQTVLVKHLGGACNRQPVKTQSTPETVQSLISSLSSENDDLRTRAEKKLIDLGRQSAAQRADIINQLLRAVESQEDLNTGNCFILGDKFNYWTSVTNIFAELRATEAIDLLITTITCGNGFSGSLLVEPSLDALVKLGPITAPKLRKALRREKEEYVRIQLSHCLEHLYWKETRSQMN